jgi:3-isopropylmalate/(R)-2-methylmalate dehydratase large subunit
MGMTITEKILAAHAASGEVAPGQFILARVDLALGNDITAPIAIEQFEASGTQSVFDPEKVCLVADHFVPNKDVKSAEQAKRLRTFSQKHGITHFYDAGRMGIEHALLPEQGLVVPGNLIIGADSHTCTYGALGAFATGVGSTDLAAAMVTGTVWLKVPESMKFVYNGPRKKWVGGKDIILYTIGRIGVDGALYRAMEFTGNTIASLPMADRLTICNMAIEAGGKSGIIAPDDETKRYVDGRAKTEYTLYQSDPEAEYAEVLEFDSSTIELQVAVPDLPGNAVAVGEIRDVPVDQAVIGSCTNGRLEDMRVAAGILKGRKVARNVRLIVIPATQQVFLDCVREGLAEIFVEAGGVFSTPTCGPCLGGHMGVLAAGEVAVATTNRNFKGRMGHLESKVYLAGPAVAAASAVAGRIASPQEVLGE